VAATSQSSGAAAYAQALFEATEAQGGLPAAGEAGDALAAMAEAWRSDRRLRGFFLAGEVGGVEKQAAMDRMGERLPRLLANFLRLLLRKGRLTLLPDVADAMTAMLNKRMHRVAVTLATAVAMPPERLARWAESLKSATGLEPVMKNVVRPELVAGAVVRIGDTVADGSARRRLAELRRLIVERAVT
jgi:F-type H+-transporting ATPase subunit delta